MGGGLAKGEVAHSQDLSRCGVVQGRRYRSAGWRRYRERRGETLMDKARGGMVAKVKEETAALTRRYEDVGVWYEDAS